MKNMNLLFRCLIVLIFTVSLVTGCASSAPTDGAAAQPSVQTTPGATTAPTTPKTPEPQKINWTMTGALVSSDASVLENFSVTVQGSIQEEENNIVRLDTKIELPDTFSFSFVTPEGGHICNDRSLGYYAFSTYCYDKTTNAPELSFLALDVEKECMIIQWHSNPDQYLVASTNAELTPQEILEHFRGFCDNYAFHP